MKTLARHHLFEFDGCDPKKINSVPFLLKTLKTLCRQAPLQEVSHSIHKFAPHGVTIVSILKESHLALSTWPEYNYAALSLQLCGGTPKLDKAVSALAKSLSARRKYHRVWAAGTRPLTGRRSAEDGRA